MIFSCLKKQLEEIKKSGDYEHRRSMFYKLMLSQKNKKVKGNKNGRRSKWQ